MADEHNNDESKKTLVAFVVGLLIGGMLVWAFSGPSDQKKNDDVKADEQTASTTDKSADEADGSTDATPTLKVAEEGVIVIKDQPASSLIAIESATYPVGEGWIGVRQYNDDQLGYILGVVRFSESQGLVPKDIILQTPTTAGKKYAVVVFKEDGDFDFSLAGDVQIDQIYTTFTAQ
ncbi:MAG: hypothetical protein KBB78_04260 [Candidatus Pacebacteria bacterium]|nr:hypothetical protein [Candidatus Paceibacterota bacterium]